MLGYLHTSDIRRYIPQLVFQHQHVSPAKANANLPLFKLDWDSVDTYKQDEYRTWITNPHGTDGSWANKSESAEAIRAAGYAPGTLPSEIDAKVKDIGFALTDEYKRAIEHFTRLFVVERTRKWRLDTVMREQCYKAGNAAINTAFTLLGDCMFHREVDGWYRGPYKMIYTHAMRFKFWRLYTGRGLVWEYAGLPELQRTADYHERLKSDDHSNAYTEFMKNLHEWGEDQEKFWNFTTVGGK